MEEIDIKNMSVENKQRLKECKTNYRRAKK